MNAYCSDACHVVARRKMLNHTWNVGSRLRRQKIKAATVEKVDPMEVFRRGNWTCHICGGGIDVAVRHPHPDSPSVDHVVPLAAGGPHCYENCRPAHLRCNLIKSDTTGVTVGS